MAALLGLEEEKESFFFLYLSLPPFLLVSLVLDSGLLAGCLSFALSLSFFLSFSLSFSLSLPLSLSFLLEVSLAVLLGLEEGGTLLLPFPLFVPSLAGILDLVFRSARLVILFSLLLCFFLSLTFSYLYQTQAKPGLLYKHRCN